MTGKPEKKHPCEDCEFCQFCSDSRCNMCRGDSGGRKACDRKKENQTEDNQEKAPPSEPQ